MTTQLKNNFQTAVAYAATNLLKKIVDDAYDLPPGSCIDVSGAELTIVLPQGTTVEKAEGKDGDGVRPTKATTNLNGWAVLAVMFEVCKKFKQHNITEDELMNAVEDAVSQVGCTTAEALTRNDPALTDIIDKWKEKLGRKLPRRQENTRRYVKQEGKSQALVIIAKAKSEAA